MTLDLDELERIGKELPSHVGIAFGIDTALDDRPKVRAFLQAAERNWQPMIDELRRLRAAMTHLDRIIEGQSRTIDTVRAENERLREALKHYADESDWFDHEDMGRGGGSICGFRPGTGAEVAKKALAQITG